MPTRRLMKRKKIEEKITEEIEEKIEEEITEEIKKKIINYTPDLCENSMDFKNFVLELLNNK